MGEVAGELQTEGVYRVSCILYRVMSTALLGIVGIVYLAYCSLYLVM